MDLASMPSAYDVLVAQHGYPEEWAKCALIRTSGVCGFGMGQLGFCVASSTLSSLTRPCGCIYFSHFVHLPGFAHFYASVR